MQFNFSVLLAIAMAAATVSAVPHYGGKSEYSYDEKNTETELKDIASNQCGVTQTASCCNSVKAGSEKHNDWTKRYEHFGGREDQDYLECSAKGADSSAGWFVSFVILLFMALSDSFSSAQDAQPFCCNATGSRSSLSTGSYTLAYVIFSGKVSALDCTPIDVSIPISGLNGLASGLAVL